MTESGSPFALMPRAWHTGLISSTEYRVISQVHGTYWDMLGETIERMTMGLQPDGLRLRV